MKYLLLALALFACAAAHADALSDAQCPDGLLCGTEELPDFWDALNNRVLHKELEKPENYPAYLYKAPGSSHTRVGRYFINGKYPTGPIECEHFSIHYKKDDKPLTWEAHNTAASNVYWHIHRAIDYFNWLESKVGYKINQETNKIVIRLDMDVNWAMWIKFAKEARYNTSQTFPDPDPDNWNTPSDQREIWFFIPKRKYLPGYVPSRWIPFLKNTVLGTVGFPLDAARVPTIIYHEWTHLMTRPYLGILRDTVLNEGYSDYYGSVIGGRPEMGNTEEFSNFPYIRYYSDDPRPATIEDHKEAGDFVPQLFWSLRRRFGAQRTDVFLWKTLKLLNEKSELKDLPAALLKTASDGTFAPDELQDLRKRLQYLFPAKPGRRGD